MVANHPIYQPNSKTDAVDEILLTKAQPKSSSGIIAALYHFLGYIMAIGIGAAASLEAELMRKLGQTRRTYSAKQRLARLQRETKLPAGAMIRPSGQLPSKDSHDKA